MTAASSIVPPPPPSSLPAAEAPAAPALTHARPTSAKSSSYIPTLDGWRAIAILLVLFDHVGTSLDTFLRGFGAHMPEKLLHRGQMGVYIFFGLSGYLITSRLLTEQSAKGRISLPQFYLRRLFRVFPPMWTYLVVAGVLAWLAIIPVRADQWVSAATFLTNYNPDRGWYMGHFWSLCVEEHFYLLWPAALVLLGARRALVAALAVTVCVPVWRYLVVNTGITGYESNLFGRTDLVIDTLLLGSAAAILMTYAGFREWIRRLPAWALYALAAGVVLTVLVRGDLLRLPQSSLLVLMMLVTVTHAGALPGRILENPVLRWIGRLSYSLYVWQQLFLVMDDWARFTPRMHPWQTFPLNLAAAFACAIASYYLVEKPLVNLGHRITHWRGPRNEGAVKA